MSVCNPGGNSKVSHFSDQALALNKGSIKEMTRHAPLVEVRPRLTKVTHGRDLRRAPEQTLGASPELLVKSFGKLHGDSLAGLKERLARLHNWFFAFIVEHMTDAL